MSGTTAPDQVMVVGSKEGGELEVSQPPRDPAASVSSKARETIKARPIHLVETVVRSLLYQGASSSCVSGPWCARNNPCVCLVEMSQVHVIACQYAGGSPVQW